MEGFLFMLIISIKNGKGSVILPYLQANNLASCCFLHAGRRYETRASETKYLLKMVLVSISHVSEAHRDDICGPSGFLHLQWVVFQERNTLRSAQEPAPLWWLLESLLFVWEKKLCHPSSLLTTNIALRIVPDKKWSQPCISGSPKNNMQECIGPMANCFSQHCIP